MSESFPSLPLLGWHNCPTIIFRLLLFCLLHYLLLLHLRLLLLLLLLLFVLLLSLSLLTVLLLVLHFGNHLVIDWFGRLLLNFLNLHLFNFLWLLFHFLLGLFLDIDLLGFLNFFLLMMLFFMILPVLVVTPIFPLLMMLLLIFLLTLLSLLRLILVIPLRLPKLFGYIANSGPILSMLLLLPTHFDEKSPIQNFTIIATPNKIDSINPSLKDNLERTFIVILNFDKSKLTKSFLNIFFNSIIVTFDQIESHILVLIIQTFDLIDQLLPLWKYKPLLFCLFSTLHPTITTLIILIKFNLEPNIYRFFPFLSFPLFIYALPLPCFIDRLVLQGCQLFLLNINYEHDTGSRANNPRFRYSDNNPGIKGAFRMYRHIRNRSYLDPQTMYAGGFYS